MTRSIRRGWRAALTVAAAGVLTLGLAGPSGASARNGAITWVDECVSSIATSPYPGDVPHYGCAINSAWARDGVHAAIVTEDLDNPAQGALFLLDTVTAEIDYLGVSDLPSTVSFSPDGSKLAIARGGNIVLVSASTGATVRTLTTRAGVESDPSWSVSGTYVAYVTAAGVRRVKAAGGGDWLMIPGADYVQYSPGGHRLGFTKDGVVYRSWLNGSNAVAVTSVPDPGRPAFAWSPDDRYIVTPDTEGSLQVVTRGGTVVSTGQGGSGAKFPSWQPLP
ncbi:MAG: hypothetical protein LCI03_16385 [Actinobacteria bacterium]|jgi:Tol biopolymer transport system component|nr:hypothetical protein [Actinomycetota bacterium]